jgi:hypothetical protein
MNYCLDILENANTQQPFDIRAFEKHMLLADTFIEPVSEEKEVEIKAVVQNQELKELVEKVVAEAQTHAHTHTETTRNVRSNTSMSIFTPRQQNSLFWCFFAAHYGVKEYEMIGSRYQNAELEEKYRISETLEKSPDRLKATNYSPSKQAIREMCAGIVSSTRDDFFSLIAFCAYYKTRTLVVFDHSRTYLEFDCEQDDSVPMVMHATRSSGKSGAWTFSLVTADVSYETDYVKLNTYAKPMKGIGSYKSDELIAMASKMGIEMDATKKEGKKELYEKIGQRIGAIV